MVRQADEDLGVDDAEAHHDGDGFEDKRDVPRPVLGLIRQKVDTLVRTVLRGQLEQDPALILLELRVANVGQQHFRRHGQITVGAGPSDLLADTPRGCRQGHHRHHERDDVEYHEPHPPDTPYGPRVLR